MNVQRKFKKPNYPKWLSCIYNDFIDTKDRVQRLACLVTAHLW